MVGGGGPLAYPLSGILREWLKTKLYWMAFHTPPPHLPPSQGMARMCCDSRKLVRQTAITYLQRALLAHELQNLTSWEWEACFLEVSQVETTPPSALIYTCMEMFCCHTTLCMKMFSSHNNYMCIEMYCSNPIAFPKHNSGCHIFFL